MLDALDAIVADESEAPEPCPTATEGAAGVAAAAAEAGAGDDSTPASFGAAAHPEKIAAVERVIIETQLKMCDLFKFLCLLIDIQARGEKRYATSSSRSLKYLILS